MSFCFSRVPEITSKIIAAIEAAIDVEACAGAWNPNTIYLPLPPPFAFTLLTATDVAKPFGINVGT